MILDNLISRTTCKTTVMILLFVLTGCAPSVKTIDILFVKLNNDDGTENTSSPDSDDIPYGKSATVTTHIQIDKAAGSNGYPLEVELWDDDGKADDQIVDTVKTKIKQNLTRKNIKMKITCTDKGELKGTKGTDTDDGSDGEIREYEIYAYEKIDNSSSAIRNVRCIPPDDEDEGQDEEGESEDSHD